MATDATGTPTPLGIPTYNINVDAPSGNGFNAAMAVIDSLVQARATLASPTFTGTPTAPTPVSTDNSTALATTAFVKGQGYLSAALTSFNGRTTAAAVPTAGDYTAAMVTNAADKSSGAAQVFSAAIQAPSHNVGSGVGSISFDSSGSGTGRLWSTGVGSFVLAVGASGQTGTVTTAGNSLTIGSSTTTPLGFFGAAGIARPGAGGVIGTTSNVLGGAAADVGSQYAGTVGSTFYTVGDLVTALKNLGLIAP